MSRKALFIFALFCGVVNLPLAPRAQAYATYNRLGYVSCTACHDLPTGGGLLTPYGRSIQGSLALFSNEKDPPDRPVAAGVDARALRVNSTGSSTTLANPFLMQADLLASAALTKRIRADVQLGPNLDRGQSGEFAKITPGDDFLVVRRVLVDYKINDKELLELGRDMPVMGLNIPDHSSFLRSTNKRNVLDYPTQLRFQYQTDQMQLLPYIVAPSYEETASNKEYGAGGRAEYALNESNSVGAEALVGNTPTLTRYVAGGFFRLSEAHWNGLMGEFLFTNRDTHSIRQAFNQENVYLKGYVAIPDWIETGLVYEWLGLQDPFTASAFMYGPSINIRLHEYLSVIADGRNVGSNGTATWSWYGQVFVHFQI